MFMIMLIENDVVIEGDIYYYNYFSYLVSHIHIKYLQLYIYTALMNKQFFILMTNLFIVKYIFEILFRCFKEKQKPINKVNPFHPN